MAKIRIDMTIPDAAASDLLRMLTMFQRNHPGCEIAVSGGNGNEVARALADMGSVAGCVHEPEIILSAGVALLRWQTKELHRGRIVAEFVGSHRLLKRSRRHWSDQTERQNNDSNPHPDYVPNDVPL